MVATPLPYVTPLEDRPYVIRVIKEPEDQLNFANAWHSDLSYLPEPPAYTLLHAWEVPDFGGDTVWSNQYLAFKTLSPGLKKTLTGLRAVHCAGMAYGTGGFLDQVRALTSMAIAPSPDASAEQVHPAVIEHPVTRRAALYVNPVYTTRFEGWSPTESQALLGYLHRHATDENFTCRLHWERHTLAIWDNRCTMHNALERLLGRAPRDVPHQREGLGSSWLADARTGPLSRRARLHRPRSPVLPGLPTQVAGTPPVIWASISSRAA